MRTTIPRDFHFALNLYHSFRFYIFFSSQSLGTSLSRAVAKKNIILLVLKKKRTLSPRLPRKPRRPMSP